MINSRLFFVLSFVLVFSACKTDNTPYAIKDFRKSLQPFLTLLVSKGIVEGYDSSMRFMTTDNELNELTKSEHPVLRSYAFRELMRRQPSNHLDILMNHLGDTAIVATDDTEWGIEYKTISDDIIASATLKNSEDSSKLIEEVITKHNSLRFAYTILARIEPQPKYYLNIKDMATREIRTVLGTSEPANSYLEFALFGLAKFKKKEDVKIIKNLLLKNIWKLNEFSFLLMEEFPDTAYLEVYEKFYPIYYRQAICSYSRFDLAKAFISSIAVYKNERSAKILSTILNQNPFFKCNTNFTDIKEQLVYAIWDNECEAYLTLRKQTEEKGQEYEQKKKNVRDRLAK
jgi:hypothetical protein